MNDEIGIKKTKWKKKDRLSCLTVKLKKISIKKEKKMKPAKTTT
jgi:hypothetical protein